jgi:hypothetical protein
VRVLAEEEHRNIANIIRNDDPGLLQAERRVVRMVALLSFANSRHDRLLIYRPSVYQQKSNLSPFSVSVWPWPSRAGRSIRRNVSVSLVCNQLIVALQKYFLAVIARQCEYGTKLHRSRCKMRPLNQPSILTAGFVFCTATKWRADESPQIDEIVELKRGFATPGCLFRSFNN